MNQNNRVQKSLTRRLGALAAVCGMAISAQAQVSVQNGSFESQAIPEGSRYYDVLHSYMPDNWTKYNGGANSVYTDHRTAAQWSTDYGTSTRYGNQVLGVGRGEISSAYQNLGIVTAGESYTLTGLVGNPNDTTGNAGQFSISFSVGTTYGGSTTIATVNHTTVGDPAKGTWNPFTLVSPVITSDQSGQNLYVLLRCEGTGGWPNYREFDNIAISTTGSTLVTNGVACAIQPTVSVSWMATNSVTFQVQWTTPPVSGGSVWTDLTAPIPGNGAINTVMDYGSSLTKRAYRVLATY